MVKSKIDNKEFNVLKPLPFDARKLNKSFNTMPKAYFWFDEKV